MSNLENLIKKNLIRKNKKIFCENNQWITTDVVKKDIEKISILLKQKKLTQKHVIIAMENSYLFIVVYLGVLLNGGTVIPIDPNLSKKEIKKIQNKSGAFAVFFNDSHCSEKFSEIEKIKIDDIKKISLSINDSIKNEISIKEEQVGVIMYTSGTTGEPKGVHLTHFQLSKAIENVIFAHQLKEFDTTYCFLPLFHINAQVIVFLSTLVSCGKIVIERKFSASKFWKIIQKENVTWVSAVPTILSILLLSKENAPKKHQLRFIRSASAPLAKIQLERFEQRFQVPIIESYGMTEAAGQICINPLPPGIRKIGSVGKPVGTNLKILAQPYEIGEILIKGKNVIHSYKDVQDQKEYFLNGWLKTGDLGYQDEEGYLYITGRKKELIIRGGKKISPREIEDVIRQHKEVKNVSVIGIPDEIYGEKIVAFISLMRKNKMKKLIEEIRILCAEELVSYKVPSLFEVISVFPTNATGKVKKHELKNFYLKKTSLQSEVVLSD